MTVEMRVCRTCDATKVLTDFPFHHSYYMNECKNCSNKRRVQRRNSDPDWHRKQRERYADDPLRKRFWYMKSKYGLEKSVFYEMLDAQGGKCAACGDVLHMDNKTGLHVDHCHASGEIRGLLCGPCNIALGFLQDDPKRVLSLAAYIEKVKV